MTRRRCRAFAASLLLPAFVSGCGDHHPGGGAPALAPGVVVAASPLLMVPGTNWSRESDRPVWRFRDTTRLHLRLLAKPAEGALPPLEIFLEPEGETLRGELSFRWDGEELALVPASAARVTVPAEKLGMGDHVLELRGKRDGRAIVTNTFDAFGWRWGEHTERLTTESFDRSRQLAAFLLFGVAGAGIEKRGGALFVGPGRGVWRLGPGGNERPSEIRIEGFNLASSPATFRARRGGHEQRTVVPPGEGGRFSLAAQGAAAEAGEERLELTVEGAEDGLFLWSRPSERPAPTPTGPPLVLVTLDTTRRDALSPYGADPEATPNLTAFAAGATVFDRAWSTAPWTLPSHASMMTGLYPSRHQAGVAEQYLGSSRPTLARLLRDAGYHTAGFAGGEICSHRFGLSQGFDHYRDPETFETRGDRLTAAVEAHLETAPGKQLFLFVNYFDPHATYQAPAEVAARFGAERLRPALAAHPLWQAFGDGSSEAWRKIIDGEAPPTPEVEAWLRAAYQAEVAFMDAALGRLFSRLQALGLYDEALIVVVADHGELLGEHGGLFSHAGRLDPELTEIPLLVKWPHQRAGHRSSALVSQVDLFATLLQAAKVPVPENDGQPLSPTPPAEAESRRVLFLEEHESRVHPLPARLKIAPNVYGVQRPNERQIVWKGGGECGLLEALRWRRTPCAADPGAVLSRLQTLLGRPVEVGESAGQLSPEAQQALRALGYL